MQDLELAVFDVRCLFVLFDDLFKMLLVSSAFFENLLDQGSVCVVLAIFRNFLTGVDSRFDCFAVHVALDFS